MSDEQKKDEQTVNEVVAKMTKETLPDVPTGLATIPKGANVHALARRLGGEIVQNELAFHCMACGWSKSLQFDEDEMEALDNNIREYTGPCPDCKSMTLVPKDSMWGADFPSMNDLAKKNKREEAKVQAEALVDAVAEKVGDFMGTGMPKPAAEPPPPPTEAVPDEPDVSDLKPR